MKQSESKYNKVERDQPFPDARMGRVTTSGKTFDGIELPSGRRYVIADNGWRRIKDE